jgi:pyruvate/oxaloacetate carboxyltransferase
MMTTVMSEVTHLYDLPQAPLITTVMSEVTRLYESSVLGGRSYTRVTSDMTVVIIGTWGRSYERVTSEMSVLIIST